jgi:hypothetical protein
VIGRSKPRYPDRVVDEEAFVDWLVAQGLTDDAHLAAYRRYIAELAKHPSLSAALQAAKEAGTSDREIANLRKVAGRIAEFDAARNAPAVEVPAPVLAVEPRQKPPSIAPPVRSPVPVRGKPSTHDPGQRRRGCVCNRPYDLYLDDDFGALARLFGGGIGIGTIVLIRLVGVLGALTLALGLAGTGGLVTILSTCMRCEGCRRRVSDLDDDERARVRKGRARVVLITIALVAGAAICGIAWWSLVKSAHRQQWG